MVRTKPWEVSDKLWEAVAPLLPAGKERAPSRVYKRRAGGGRKRANLRLVLGAILRVLRTGCQWNSITKVRDGVSSSSAHRYFQEWTRQGVFLALWQKKITEYDELEGVSWEWQAADGTLLKAPLAREAVGPNPTDRGKKWKQDTRPVGRAWHPSCVVRNRSKPPRLQGVGKTSALQGLSSG
ncbi:MAG: transposase [Opitutaceae bacterium]|jgi:transposase|nr:transposase [Opitutaceae bacterium]